MCFDAEVAMDRVEVLRCECGGVIGLSEFLSLTKHSPSSCPPLEVCTCTFSSGVIMNGIEFIFNGHKRDHP